jgi:BlaR1 peptidase M56
VMSRAERGVSVALRMVPDCYWLASLLYLAVFSALMLRLLAGLSLSWRIVRRATPIGEDWVGGFDVRVSCTIDAPVTFGSVILLPNDYTAWTTAKRLAVLAHEGSHVARCDFAIQLAAAVNRMVFWFNPFTWWLQRHLSDLAEAASDDAAIASLDDRFGYAEILLELSGRVPGLPGAVAMARRSAVVLRIERILSETPLSAGMSQRGRAMMAACIVPITFLLSSIVVSPPPRLETPIGTRIRPVATVTGDEAAATGTKQSAKAHPLAAAVPEMAPQPPVSTEAVAASAPTVLPPTRNPEVQISPQTPALSPARLSAPLLRASARGPSPRASHSINPNRVTSLASQQAVESAKPPSHATSPQDPATQESGEVDQPPFFERLVNATCAATDILRLGPAYLIPRGGPAYLAQAHFFRSRDGRPWVTLYYTGGQAANLPVVIMGSEIKFIRSSDMTYTLSPSHNNRLVSFAKHPDGGTVDFACGAENTHPSPR